MTSKRYISEYYKTTYDKLLQKILHSIGLSGNQRSLDWQGSLTLDFLYLSDGWLRYSSENCVKNINMLEIYHKIRGNLEI